MRAESTSTTSEPIDSPIPMVDLVGQYRRLKQEMDEALEEVLLSARFIKGPVVSAFEDELSAYLGGSHALGVGSGTDALQVALMAIGVGPGDEVITPAFSFVAAAEAVVLLGAQPVFAEIDPETFNIDPDHVASLITDRTAAVIPVHLYGQAADMGAIIDSAADRGIFVIEDNAQAIGSKYRDRYTGYIGQIGCLSFFPSKNLGCYGDGGAVLTNDADLHGRMVEIANHGAKKKYRNDRVGVNSRLDAIQAAVLRVKLRHLDEFVEARQRAADIYDSLFAGIPEIVTPITAPGSTHVYHQYTVRLTGDAADRRDALAAHLSRSGIASSVYYPSPLYHFEAYEHGLRGADRLVETESACRSVLSVPMHTELTRDQQERIVSEVATFLTEFRHG